MKYPLAALLILLWIMALADLALSLKYLDGGRLEANPLAALLFTCGPGAIVVFKLSLTALGTWLLWLARRKAIAFAGAASCCAVYLALMGQWWRMVHL